MSVMSHCKERREFWVGTINHFTKFNAASLFPFETGSRVSCTGYIRIYHGAGDGFELWVFLSASPCPVYAMLEIESSAHGVVQSFYELNPKLRGFYCEWLTRTSKLDANRQEPIIDHY